jgi:hypothetical protein
MADLMKRSKDLKDNSLEIIHDPVASEIMGGVCNYLRSCGTYKGDDTSCPNLTSCGTYTPPQQ